MKKSFLVKAHETYITTYVAMAEDEESAIAEVMKGDNFKEIEKEHGGGHWEVKKA